MLRDCLELWKKESIKQDNGNQQEHEVEGQLHC